MLSSQKQSLCLAAKRSKRKCISKYSTSTILGDVGLSQDQAGHGSSHCFGLEYLTSDCLEYIALFLNSQSALGKIHKYVIFSVNNVTFQPCIEVASPLELNSSVVYIFGSICVKTKILMSTLPSRRMELIVLMEKKDSPGQERSSMI